MADLADPAFDRYARIVRAVLDVPVALVTLLEPARQVFLGAVGLPEPIASERQTPLSHSVCQYVVADRAPLIVSDTRLDARLHRWRHRSARGRRRGVLGRTRAA